ncbi:MAG: DnaJ domain-containing protein [Desulfobulbaceae bacterium]
MGLTEHIRSAHELIQAFSRIKSTEELILFVAGSDGMLSFCRELLDQFDRNAQSSLIQDVEVICAARGVLPGALYSEVRKVLLALNRYHDADGDHYATLGLRANASPEEIKKAYRTLSKQYHPDRTQDPDGGKRFMEISGAYHALMADYGKQKAKPEVPWRNNRTAKAGRTYSRDRKIFLFTAAALLLVLSAVSIHLAARYNRQATISQLPLRGLSREPVSPAQPAAPAEQQPLTHLDDQPAVSENAVRHVPPSPPPYLLRRFDIEKKTARPALHETAATPEEKQHETAAPETAKIRIQPTSKKAPHASATVKPLNEAAQAASTPKKSERKTEAETASSGQPATKIHVAAGTDEQEPRGPASGAITRPQKEQQADRTSPFMAIKEVLRRYEQHYSNRELTSFFDLFTPDATENGRPMTLLNDQYRSLFAHTQTISMQLQDLNWHPNQGGFDIEGNFKARYAYKDGRNKEHKGAISFHLVDNHGELQIRTLRYVFQE